MNLLKVSKLQNIMLLNYIKKILYTIFAQKYANHSDEIITFFFPHTSIAV